MQAREGEMHELSVETVFSAAHAIVISGEREPMHGHDWHVRAVVAGERLDDDGLLADFHLVEHELSAVVAPFRNRSLNETPPFDRLNPTAEQVAQHIAGALADRLAGHLREGVDLREVSVSEAPGCRATYRRG